MTPEARSGAQYTGKERWSVAISAILGFWMDFYNLSIIAFLMGTLQKALSITLVEAGTIASLTLLGSVAGGILFGWLGDRVGRKNALLLALGAYSLGAIVSAFSWNYNSLLIFRFVTGVGLGGEWGAGMVLLNEVWNRDRRGLGSAMVQAMAVAGVAAAAIIGTWAITHFSPDWGWRVAFAAGGSPLLLMIYVRFSMPESRLWLEFDRLRKLGELPAEKAQQKNPLIEMFRQVSGRYLILGIVAWSAFVISNQSVSIFMPSLMIRDLGASPDVVRGATLLNTLWGGAIMIALGAYSDRIGRKLGVIGPAVIAIIASAALYYACGFKYAGSILMWPVFWCYLLWTVGQSAAAMFGPWMSELFPVEMRSTAVATVYTLGRTIGASAPIIVPVLAARFGGALINGMVFGALGSVICLVVAFFLPETAGRRFAVLEGRERDCDEPSQSWAERREA
jgi:MFS family permease